MRRRVRWRPGAVVGSAAVAAFVALLASQSPAVLGTSDRQAARASRAPRPAIFTIDFTTPRDGWAITPRGLWRTANGGATWSATAIPPEFARWARDTAGPGEVGELNPVSVLSAGTVVVATVTNPQSAHGWRIYETRDAGRHWHLTGWLPGEPPAWVGFISQRVGWDIANEIGASGCETMDLAQTTDGGARWRSRWWPVAPPGPLAGGCGDITGVRFLSSTVGFVTGFLNFGIYFARSTDGGRTWSWDRGHAPPTPREFPDSQLTAWLPVGTGDGRVFLPVTSGSRGFLDASSDRGVSWHVVGLLPRLPANTVLPLLFAARGAANLWMAQKHDVWVASQGGRTWRLALSLPGGEVVTGLSTAGQSSAWVAVELDTASSAPVHTAALLRTTDAGRSWVKMALP